MRGNANAARDKKKKKHEPFFVKSDSPVVVGLKKKEKKKKKKHHPYPHCPASDAYMYIGLMLSGQGHSRRLAVGKATGAILANICLTTPGHSEWLLIPTQHSRVVGKNILPFSRAADKRSGVGWGGDKRGCRKPAGYRPLGSTRNVVRCVGAPDCGAAHYSCAEGRDRQKPHQVAAVMGPAGRIWG